MNPPTPDRIPHQHEKHGDVRIDNYFWMKERTSPKVIAHLKEENAYLEKAMRPMADLQESLFEELKKRIKQDDASVPTKLRNYEYYSRVEKGKDHPIFCRRKVGTTKEEILVDGNEVAKGHPFFSFGGIEISPDETTLAYTADFQGRRFYTAFFKDLTTGKVLKQTIKDIDPMVEFANDNKTLFYSKQNPETLRSEKVFRYHLPSDKSEEIYFEKDETFDVGISKSRTHKFIFMVIHSTLSSEVWYLDANKPNDKFKLFQKREPKHEYSIDDAGDKFIVTTNWKAKNFRVMTSPYSKTTKSNWRELIKHNKDVLIEHISPFKSHFVVTERENGLTHLRIIDRTTNAANRLQFKDPAYLISEGRNWEFDTPTLRYGYESPSTPDSVYEYDLKTGQHKLLKQQEVLGGFNSADYEVQRFFLPSHDEVDVPVTMVYKKGTAFNANTPLLVYGYGSYGISMDPYFSENRISLLDRGFVYVIAHIRGGSELGRKWYEDGRQMKKKNTFLDFIAVTEGLHKKGISSPRHTYAMGGSAGGLLMGAVANMRPDLYNGMVAQVAFVDVVTTMLDPSIPLTTAEYDQWGNPNQKKAYDYIKSYSPYDNVGAKDYPTILAVTGLHDSQVQYWEPAKWVALLREKKAGPKSVFLKTDMEAGHGGKSGRFSALHDVALMYSFLIGLEQGQLR